MGFATMTDATAELAVPLAIAIAVARRPRRRTPQAARPVGSGRGRRDLRRLCRAAVASGDATFAGYVKLDDTATWLGMLDYVLERGRR